MKPLRGFRFAGAYFSIEMNALRAKFTDQLIFNFSFSLKMGYFVENIYAMGNKIKMSTTRKVFLGILIVIVIIGICVILYFIDYAKKEDDNTLFISMIIALITLLLGAIRALVAIIPLDNPKNSETTPPVMIIETSPNTTPANRVPLILLPHRNPHFTGRQELLEGIRKTFEESKEAIALTQAIAGLGGIGKTQTALEYAHRYKDYYHCICWVNAETPNTILSSFQDFAKKNEDLKEEMKEAEVIIEAVRDWMQQNDNWLFIYDNAEDEKTLQPYLPAQTGTRQHILITSRNKRFMKSTAVNINVFTETEACDFIYKYTQKPADEHFKDLAKEMGYLPLALDQVGAYMFETKKSYADYLSLYHEKSLSLLQKYRDNPEKQTAATTWEISLEKIRNNKAAKQLLHLCAFFDSENIFPAFFIKAREALPDELKKSIEDQQNFDDAIAELTKYSLVSQDDDGILSIHRLVQEVIRERLKRFQPNWRNRCILILNGLRNFNFSTRKSRDLFLILATHINAVTNEINDEDATEEVVNLYLFLGYGYNQLADYDLALEYYEKAKAIYEKVLGTEHPSTATTYNNMAAVYRAKGDYDKALEYFGKAIAIREKVLGKEHPDTAITYNNIALVYDNKGEYDLALEYYGKSLDVKEKVLDKEHPSMATTYNNMADVFRAKGDYDNALKYNNQALAIREKVQGTEHPDIATNYNNMALVYYNQGKYDLALEYYGKALTIRIKVLGAEHPYTTGTYNDMADTFKKTGNPGSFNDWLTAHR